MKKKIIFLISSFILFFALSCETLDLDQTESPSQLTSRFLDANFTFNYVQIQLADFVNSSNSFTQDVTRQTAMTGGNTYDNAFSPVNFNNNWSDAFNILNAIKIMEPKALDKKQFFALGASKIIRVYIIATLVDMYGDIPFTESLQGVKNFNPKYDSSASIYKQLLFDLEEAKTIIGQTGGNVTDLQDLYYGGSADNWITLANTIKLKMLVTARLATSDIGISNISSEINSIIASGKYIDVPSKDFAFKYGNSRFNPNTRHPGYNANYEIGARDYIGNYFMWTMTQEKRTLIGNDRVLDPRTAFYFYRQDDSPSNSSDFILPRLSRPTHYSDPKYSSFYNPTVVSPYKISNWIGQNAMPAGGFWGRDHGDNSGIPQDGNLRTVGGVYPIGGKYSTTDGSVQNSGSEGNKGVGIMPIILSSYVHFMISESILKSGVTGNAKAEFVLGVTQSIEKVITIVNNYPLISSTDRPNLSFPEGIYAPGTINNNGNLNTVEFDNLSTYGKINFRQKKDYLDFVSNFYDTLNDEKKLELIIKEYYIASWGNGIEPYNNYRRTGFPSNFQPTLEFSQTPFFSTALYPADAENNNPNTPLNRRTKKVFWDKANLNLH